MLDRAARRQRPRLLFNDVLEGLNVVAKNSATTQNHFETVVVFGVVTACDLDATVAKGVGCKIKLWRCGEAHI